MLTLQPKFLSPILFDFHLHFKTTAVEQRNWHLSTEAEIPLSLRGCLVQIPGGALDATTAAFYGRLNSKQHCKWLPCIADGHFC